MKNRTKEEIWKAEKVCLAISSFALGLAINLASFGHHYWSAFLAGLVPVFTFAAARCGNRN